MQLILEGPGVTVLYELLQILYDKVTMQQSSLLQVGMVLMCVLKPKQLRHKQVDIKDKTGIIPGLCMLLQAPTHRLDGGAGIW